MRIERGHPKSKSGAGGGGGERERERERERAAQEEEALDDLCVKERESATVRQAIIGAASAATLVKTSERDGADSASPSRRSLTQRLVLCTSKCRNGGNIVKARGPTC